MICPECERLREEVAHRVGVDDKIRHLIDPEGKRICGTDTMVEEVLLDLNTWADAAIDACAKVGSLTTELREWKDIAEERLFTAERLRTLCREAADLGS